MSQQGIEPTPDGPDQGAYLPEQPAWALSHAKARVMWISATPVHCILLGNRNSMLTSSATGLSTPSQSFVPPPRTSSRSELPLMSDGSSAQNVATASETSHAPAAQSQSHGAPTLAVPGQSSSPEASNAASGDATAPRSESIGRGSKRSLTGRRRDRSAGSKRKDEKEEPNEKAARTDQPKTKKKGGILSFLNCCGSSDQPQQSETADVTQPSKPATKPQQQATRAQQPSPRQPNASTTDTSATRDSKEVIDEKLAQKQTDPGASRSDAAAPLADSEKPSPSDGAVDKPVPYLPEDKDTDMSQSPQANPPPSAQTSVTPVFVPPAIITSGASSSAPGTNLSPPSLEVQAPTPTVPQQAEDATIFDQTPQQKQLDDELENKDKTLSEQEAHQIEEKMEVDSQEETRDYGTTALPPPPPLPQTQTESVGPSSMVSTPEPPGKWLLPPIRPEFRGRKCLVLDLDETLVHSSFKVSPIITFSSLS